MRYIKNTIDIISYEEYINRCVSGDNIAVDEAGSVFENNVYIGVLENVK